MEIPDSVMRDLHLDVHLGLSESFSLSPQTLTSASTVSSCTSSDYSPFTPTSGRSTPPRSNSMDFGASFDSYNSMSSYDFTPPSSAVSTSFSMSSSFASDGCELLLPDLPVTPTRNRANPEFSALNLSGCGSQTQTTPSQNISVYGFHEDPFNSAFTLTPSYGNNWDAASMWVHPDSPMSFPVIPTPSQVPMRSLDGAKSASEMLQQQTRKAHKKSPVCRSKKRKAPVKRHHGLGELGKIQVISKCRHACTWVGCNKHYQRKEHMKRHYETIHLKIRMEDCQWCDHDSNRGDNFKTHLEKHLKAESKSPRVKVVQDPVERAKIQALLVEIGTRPRKGVKSERKPKAKL